MAVTPPAGAYGEQVGSALAFASLAPLLDDGPVADFTALLDRLHAEAVPDGRDPVRWFADQTLPAAG